MGVRGAKGQPTRLDTFRLTSADEGLLRAAATRYGGTVQPWAAQPGQFELFTEKDELPCIVAPQEVSQWYEMWSGGGCQRRCDGEMVTVAGANNGSVDQPCLCDPDKRDCKLTTRLSVMLHELPGVGTWRLETHGFYAATELPASAEVLISLARRGNYAPAALAIEERIVKRDGQTKKFPVPVLRIQQALATLMTGEIMGALPEPAPALPAPNGNGNGHTRAVENGERGGYAQQAVAGDPPEDALKNVLDTIQELWGDADRKDLAKYGMRVLERKPENPKTNHVAALRDYRVILNDLRDRESARKTAFAVYGEVGGDTTNDATMREDISRALGVAVQTRKALTAAEWRRFAKSCQPEESTPTHPPAPEEPAAPADGYVAEDDPFINED